jgi:hypothetical protein
MFVIQGTSEQERNLIFEVIVAKSNGESETLTFNALSSEQLQQWNVVFDTATHCTSAVAAGTNSAEYSDDQEDAYMQTKTAVLEDLKRDRENRQTAAAAASASAAFAAEKSGVTVDLTSMTSVKQAFTASIAPFLPTSEVHDRVEQVNRNQVAGMKLFSYYYPEVYPRLCV